MKKKYIRGIVLSLVFVVALFVFSMFTNKDNADKLVSELKSKGYPAFIDIYKK